MRLSNTLQQTDSEIYSLIKHEQERQKNGLELIASENYTSLPVLQCLGSCLTNKYSEGYPNNRYYGGNFYIDKIEILCQNRALEAFGLDKDEWGVNVQALSGSPANFAIYTALLEPHDRLMGLSLFDGGHLTHGHVAFSRKVTASSIYFESMSYNTDKNGIIDYSNLEQLALKFKPKLIIAGGSAYPREIDFLKFREICDKTKSILFSDISHIGGLVAGKVLKNNPFLHSDVVMTTTHKTLRGPRGALIFFRKGERMNMITKKIQILDYENKINHAVFPVTHGGPHNNVIAAIAVCLKEAMTDGYRQYCKNVVYNADVLGKELKRRGYVLVTGGTDTHLLLLNLRDLKVDTNVVSKICEDVAISVNKNSIPGDRSVLKPAGIRIGTAAITTREMDLTDMPIVAKFLDEAIQIAINKESESEGVISKRVATLKGQVEAFVEQFEIPGKDYL